MKSKDEKLRKDKQTYSRKEFIEISYGSSTRFVWVLHGKKNTTVNNQQQNEIVEPFAVYDYLKQFTKSKIERNEWK